MYYILLALIVIVVVGQYRRYIKSTYYLVTKTSPIQLYFDIGRLGEYLTYRCLRSAEKSGAKFLFNIYIPKGENETTEIDVLMIHAKGLFVFESKNYSGWIFGSESQKNWYQTLPKGRGRSHKESFYNPIMQNRGHMKHLKGLLGETVPMYSIITFSERCTLKKLEIKSKDVYVINRNQVYDTVVSICDQVADSVLDETQIAEIYNMLYPYTQVDTVRKEQHVKNIESIKEKATVQGSGDITASGEFEVEKRQLQTNCPRCGGDLVLRHAKKGDNVGKSFYGCSNYPKCRFMRDLAEKITEDEKSQICHD